jgi:hypothetical protein
MEACERKGKVKVKLSLCLTKQHTMKTYWGSGGIAPRILDLGTKWREGNNLFQDGGGQGNTSRNAGSVINYLDSYLGKILLVTSYICYFT